jgi:hypothetical protein
VEGGGEDACGQPAPAAINDIDTTAPAVAACVLNNATRLSVRSGMTSSVNPAAAGRQRAVAVKTFEMRR